MDQRKNITTAMRKAIWEAHGRKCAFTGEPIEWHELQIDHVIPVKGNTEQKEELIKEGVIRSDFDINGFANLLPTKNFRNNQKSNHISNKAAMIFFLTMAQKHLSKVEDLYDKNINSDLALKGYLQIKVQAEKNDISIDDLFRDLQHQSDGEVPLRFAPEIDAPSVSSANSQYAAILMNKRFALGSGSVTEVVLQNDVDDQIICRTATEFLEAKHAGFLPETQYDINCYGLADQTSELLRAVKEAKYASRSSIRSPRITLKNLAMWSSDWVRDCFVEREQPNIAKYPTILSLVDDGLLSVEEQSEWILTIHSEFGLDILLRELMRGDLDDDGEEEILIFALAFAHRGSLKAGSVCRAKINDKGLLERVEIS